MMKRVSIIFIMVVLSFSNVLTQTENALKNSINNKRSDTLDILDYKLWMDFRSMYNSEIQASCRVKFTTKLPDVNSISLDLLGLQVDSIKQGDQLISFTYNDTLIVALLTSALDQGATDSVTVFYQGTPQGDESGWGGFYFSGNYAFNLGVGFAADPHNYGRVWHPCFDNFVERATYEITVVTSGSKRAYSNGLIVHDDVTNSNEIERTWVMNDPIPTYLACIGVADYVHVDQIYQSTLYGATIPMMLIAEPSDTTNMKSSFVNLTEAMSIYESNYGPYLWEKVGFTLVPFSSGAMEHATCVMYPKVAANGGLANETLMAHELSHHWWGNLVTCRTSEDMWINEGMARYSEAIFLENLYGYDDYLTEMKSVHRKVLQQAHINDGDFLPISGVPHSATYGTHSYDKGSTIVHNMRTYMGDANFFDGLHAIQTSYVHSDIDAADFRNKMDEYTTANMTEFFEDWVYNPGFPGFVIDSFVVTTVGELFSVKVFVQQKLRGTNQYYRNVPLEVTFMDANREVHHAEMIVNGQYTSNTFNVDFYPELVFLNGEDKILNAVTAVQHEDDANNTFVYDYAYFRLISSGLNDGDTALVRMEHCRVAPDPIQNYLIYDEYQLSTERYWKISGIWPSNFEPKAWLFYDARNNANGNLDNDLLLNPYGTSFVEDSLVLFYRPNAGTDWMIHPDYTLNIHGNSSDGSGRFIVNQLFQGEYAFGYHFGATSLEENSLAKNGFQLYPNPGGDAVAIDVSEINLTDEFEIVFWDQAAREVMRTVVKDNKIDIKSLPKGAYFVCLRKGNIPYGTIRFIKE